MTKSPSFAAFRDNIVDNQAFQRACQRYANGNGSSEAVAMSALDAAGFIALFEDANRYRFLRSKGVQAEGGLLTGERLDQAVDAALALEG